MVRLTLITLLGMLLFEPVGLPIAVPIGVVIAVSYYGIKNNLTTIFPVVTLAGIMIDMVALNRWGETSLLLLCSLALLFLMVQFVEEVANLGLLGVAALAYFLYQILSGVDPTIVGVFTSTGTTVVWYVILNQFLSNQSITVKRTL